MSKQASSSIVDMLYLFPPVEKCHRSVPCDAMVDLPYKYTPKNDFCVWFEKFGSFALPLIIGKVVSFRSGKDRYHTMLLQAVALAQLTFALRKSGSTEHPFIVAVYLSRI